MKEQKIMLLSHEEALKYNVCRFCGRKSIVGMCGGRCKGKKAKGETTGHHLAKLRVMTLCYRLGFKSAIVEYRLNDVIYDVYVSTNSVDFAIEIEWSMIRQAITKKIERKNSVYTIFLCSVPEGNISLSEKSILYYIQKTQILYFAQESLYDHIRILMEILKDNLDQIIPITNKQYSLDGLIIPEPPLSYAKTHRAAWNHIWNCTNNACHFSYHKWNHVINAVKRRKSRLRKNGEMA